MKNALSYALIIVGCLFLLVAVALIVMYYPTGEPIKSAAIGPPISIIIGIVLILLGVIKLRSRPK